MPERIFYRQTRRTDIRAARLWASFSDGPVVIQSHTNQPTYSCPWCWRDLVVGVPAGQLFDAFSAIRCGCGGWSEAPSHLLEGLPAFHCDLARNRNTLAGLYRYLPSEEYLSDLLEGKIWISTIDSCRNTEDPLRVDAGEASRTYNISLFGGDGDNKDLQTVAARLGYEISPSVRDITLAYNTTIARQPNFHVLCTSAFLSQHLLAKFGQFCVRINHPASLLERVGLALQTGVRRAEVRRVFYGGRTYADLQPAPQDIGFLKPLKYYREAEARFAWHPTRAIIEPMSVRISVTSDDFTVVNTDAVDKSSRFDPLVPPHLANRNFRFDVSSRAGRSAWNRFARSSRPLYVAEP